MTNKRTTKRVVQRGWRIFHTNEQGKETQTDVVFYNHDCDAQYVKVCENASKVEQYP